MAHLVIVVCDRCLAAGEEIKATEEFTVAFDGKKPRQLALCGEHYKPWADLREFAESEGVTLRDGSPASSSEPCPECGRRFKDARGLASHVRLGHRETGEIACPDCGRVMRGQTGLMNHRRHAHGVTGEES